MVVTTVRWKYRELRTLVHRYCLLPCSGARVRYLAHILNTNRRDSAIIPLLHEAKRKLDRAYSCIFHATFYFASIVNECMALSVPVELASTCIKARLRNESSQSGVGWIAMVRRMEMFTTRPCILREGRNAENERGN